MTLACLLYSGKARYCYAIYCCWKNRNKSKHKVLLWYRKKINFFLLKMYFRLKIVHWCFLIKNIYIFHSVLLWLFLVVSALSNVPLYQLSAGCIMAKRWEREGERRERMIAHWSMNIPNGASFSQPLGCTDYACVWKYVSMFCVCVPQTTPEENDPVEQVLQYHLPPPKPKHTHKNIETHAARRAKHAHIHVHSLQTHAARRISVSRDWSEQICFLQAKQMKPTHQLICQHMHLCACTCPCITDVFI